MMAKKDLSLFLSSLFFVLGFSTVFALLGVLLETVLLNVSYEVQKWLGYIGGTIIIFFGLYLVGLIKPAFLEKEHKFKVRKFKSAHLTSFVFGAAFAVGWTPCVSAALGAILGLAAASPSSGFILLMSYTLGLGLPFLAVGLFSSQATVWIDKVSAKLKYVNLFFGALLILLGIFVFTSRLSLIANHPVLASLFSLQTTSSIGSGITGLSLINMALAFFAGIVSFLSPCILPLVPAFLTYLASIATKK